jgi:transposase
LDRLPELVEAWIDPAVARVYAVLDNLNVHTAAPDVQLFSLLHPRWEFVFQPSYAAYLNLIEPWWKVMRSLALKGRRFETWTETRSWRRSVARATAAYWMDYRHRFIWGRRRRHRPSRRLGTAAVPNLVLI